MQWWSYTCSLRYDNPAIDPCNDGAIPAFSGMIIQLLMNAMWSSTCSLKYVNPAIDQCNGGAIAALSGMIIQLFTNAMVALYLLSWA